jgi:hypothetical protein
MTVQISTLDLKRGNATQVSGPTPVNAAPVVSGPVIAVPAQPIHPIFTDNPVSISPVAAPIATTETSLLVGGQPTSTSTGQNVKIGSVPTASFSAGTAPVLYSTELGYGSVGLPGTGAGAAISSSSTVSTSPSFEAESNVEAAAGAPNTAVNVPVSASIESAVQADIPGGSLFSSLPSWFWILLGALVIYLWYTGESPRNVVREVTA